tara:strand:+ start:7286 stop:7912 length:627 start_codon:yes stop_codon:yes gene_type:complete
MNHTELVTAAKAYADRQDIEVSQNLDTFILMTEARINRVLKTREQSTRIYTPTIKDQEYYTLPPDYSGMRNIQLNVGEPSSTNDVISMHFVTPEQIDCKRSSSSGEVVYTIVNNQIQIYPLQDVGLTIEIVYYQKVPNLNSVNSTNWLSDSHPDIYLSGVVSQIEAFVKNYEISSSWDDRMSRSIDELEVSDISERWSGAPMVMRNVV